MTGVLIVVFDADGTIFNSMPIYTEIFSGQLERKFGIPREDSSILYNSSAGIPLGKQFEMMLTKHRKPTDKIQELVNEFFELAAKNVPDIFPDIKPAFEKLAGHKRIISTNTRQDILNGRVLHHGLEKHLDHYFGTNGFKRKEEHFDHVKRIYDLSEEDFRKTVVFVGDGKPDMELAKRLGIVGIGRIGTTDSKSLEQAGASYIVTALTELPEILEKL